MKTLTVSQAKDSLDEVLDEALAGETIVILSNNSRIASPDLERVNVLFRTTLRRTDRARAQNLKKNEVLLDEADGLD